MRVMCAYCDIKPQTQHALDLYAPECEYVDTSATIWDYGKAVADRWTGEDDLVVIEDDKEITAEVLPSFANCGYIWCSYSYLIYPEGHQREIEIGLGCTRYSARAQQIVDKSEFMCRDQVFFDICPHCKGEGCWNLLDARIAHALRCHGINVHVHGHINHFHDYSGLECKSATDILRYQHAINRQYKTHFDQADELAGPDWNKELWVLDFGTME